MRTFQRVVVLGGSGLLGRYVVELLRAASVNVSAPRHEATPIEAGMPIEPVAPIEDFTAVRKAVEGADCVVNCAAWVDVTKAEDDKDRAYAVNATGAENVAKAANEVGAAVVQVSTDSVFGGDNTPPKPRTEPYDEDDEPKPISVYGRSKLEGERLVKAVNKHHHIVRVTGLYGRPAEGTVPLEDKNRRSKLYFLLSRQELLSEDERRMLYLDDDRRMQPTWARATAEAILRIARSDDFGIWHASCAGDTTLYGFGCAMAASLGCDPPSIAEPDPNEHLRPKYAVLKNRRLAGAGLPPLPTWQDALASYLAEIKNWGTAGANRP